MAQNAGEPTVTTIDTSMDGTQTEVEREPEGSAQETKALTQADIEAAVKAHEEKLRKEFEASKQADINAAISKRLARERRGQTNGKKDEPAQTTTDKDEDLSTLSKREILERRDFERSFDRLSMKHAAHLSERQLKTMEVAVLAERPEHMEEWMSEYLSEMGWAKPTTQPAQREAASNGEQSAKTNGQPPRKPNPAAVDNTSVASSAVSWKQMSDPTQWTKEHIQQILSEKGLREGQRHIKQALEAWGKTVRVMPG